MGQVDPGTLILYRFSIPDNGKTLSMEGPHKVHSEVHHQKRLSLCLSKYREFSFGSRVLPIKIDNTGKGR
ncbi:hypothetical protein BGZ76_001436 [Entomortierella beljakovae]|nr:hypothetical protein BGZ76_001436 [Entomortierella beljakovae]